MNKGRKRPLLLARLSHLLVVRWPPAIIEFWNYYKAGRRWLAAAAAADWPASAAGCQPQLAAPLVAPLAALAPMMVVAAGYRCRCRCWRRCWLPLWCRQTTYNLVVAIRITGKRQFVGG